MKTLNLPTQGTPKHAMSRGVYSVVVAGLCVWATGCSNTQLYLRGGILDKVPGSERVAEAPKETSKVAAHGGATSFVKSEASLDEVRIRLLEGVLTNDRAVIQVLLTPDFAWREDESPLQETPFQFWDRHKLWGELQHLLGAKVAKEGRLAISPKGSDRPGFRGSRLAWRQVGGEWRLAYFYAANDTR